MSVIRRPASVSRGFIDSNQPPKDVTRLTQFKIYALKNYFADQYYQINREANEREVRAKRMLLRLGVNHQMTEEQKAEYFANFVKAENNYIRMLRLKFNDQQYERIQMIGKGKVSEIWLAFDKYTSQFVALKIMKKEAIIYYGLASQARAERDILSHMNFPGIVNLISSFQDPVNLYIAMEYLPGGDLQHRLSTVHTFPERQVEFYIGEVAVAISALHQFGYIHHNIKLDNILISETGHVKLSGFGAAQNFDFPALCILYQHLMQLQVLIEDQAAIDSVPIPPRPQHQKQQLSLISFSYSSPELIAGKDPTPACDYWSLGVIMYQMLYGRLPFTGANLPELLTNICTVRQTLHFPPNADVSVEARDLISNLLCYEEQRFEFNDIKIHPFFRTFNFNNWDANQPPYVPILQSPTDTSNFPQDFPDPDDAEDVTVPLRNVVEDFAWLGFTFKNRPMNGPLEEFMKNH